jgi:LPXTG-site transpeptidase (sortase) family protein
MTKKIFSYVLVFAFAFFISAQTIPKIVRASLALPQCQDGLDNDSDGVIDNLDPQCHTDGDASNAFSYDANIDNEAAPPGGGLALPQCQDGLDNDSDGVIDNLDPQCHTDGDASNAFSYDANIDNEASPVIITSGGGGGGGHHLCSDTLDNDSDGVVDSADPGCHSDGDPTNTASYNPFDDSELNTNTVTTAPVPQVLGATTGPVECGGLTGRPCSLQKTGGTEVSQRTLLNRKANAIAMSEHNELIIPKLGIDKNVLYYQSTDSLFKEAMLLPWTSTPDKGGNTVLVGHAYYLRNNIYSKSTFYELDKMSAGDEITMYWKGVKYTYIVKEMKKVTPDQIDIESPTTTPTLTIYSCGRFTNLTRTVVVATLKA